jgi:hypothetical protein
VDPRIGLEDMDKRIFLPYRESNSDPSVVQPVASRYTDCAIICERYLEKDETALHILHDGETALYSRFRHPGNYVYFLEPYIY